MGVGAAGAEPNENVDADADALGDPLDGTAAPKANAVEGEVEGGLEPNENPANGLAGVVLELASDFGSEAEVAGLAGVPKLNPLVAGADVDFGSSFFSDGAPKLNGVDEVGFAFALELEAEEPKLNGLAGLLVDSLLLWSAGAEELDPPNENGVDALGASSCFSLLLDAVGVGSAGLPKVNGDDDDSPDEEMVGTKPVPLEPVDDDPAVGALRKPNEPEAGTEGGLGIDGPEEVLPFVGDDPCPGFQPDLAAISSVNLATWSPSGARTVDRSRNGSSLIASFSVCTSEALRPRIEVQYSTSAEDGSDLSEPEPFVFSVAVEQSVDDLIRLDSG